MKLLLLAGLIALAAAAPQAQSPQDVQILRYDINNSGLDSHDFAFELSDGTKHEERGELRNAGSENEIYAVQGQYSWVGPDGVTYTVTYIADENGFQPTIQQTPGGAVPEAVITALQG
ncbi:endocuticle structural glycoprotein SgAbd-5-like [Plodia interpunctella]|uniref:endocuticle structural glycoprotein SgAbd-5-like n=1 Tax=Plodia interpunctella TaxID=58824 RepID=UPI003100CB28